MTLNPPFYRNALEPAALIEQFLAHPPLDFQAQRLTDGTPSFEVDFDLLTTLDSPWRERVMSLPGHGYWQGLLSPRTRFVGSTVSEFLPLAWMSDVRAMPGELRRRFGRRYPFLIIKDIPKASPLLNKADNQVAEELAQACRQAGFVLLEGQALAYLPIDFASTDEWLGRFSGKRRYDIRRKLRQRDRLDISIWQCGGSELAEATVREQLYDLYRQVYAQSEVHFDQHSKAFFDAVWSSTASGGFLFLYRAAGKIIGWKLCFVVTDKLIDKYVGFAYPEAREFGLYFNSWVDCLEFALAHGLRYYVMGWTDAEIKAYLGARFCMTRHAVLVRNPVLRFGLQRFRGLFASDARWLESTVSSSG